MKQKNFSFIGNTKQIQTLEIFLREKNVSHRFLFAGPEHIGKHTLARRFARSLICGEEKIEKEGSEDSLCELTPPEETKKGITKKKSIEVESVRKMIEQLNLTTHKGKYRVLIINEAEKMTRNAANAFLKTLEEPQEKTVIILVSSQPGKILPTILSRVITIDFHIPKKKEIQDLLAEEKKLSREKRDIYETLSLSRPGLLREMLENKRIYTKRKKMLENIREFDSWNITERFDFSEKLAKNTEDMRYFCMLFIAVLRKEHISAGDTKNIYTKIEALETVLEKLETNVNKRLLLDNAFLSL